MSIALQVSVDSSERIKGTDYVLEDNVRWEGVARLHFGCVWWKLER